MLDDRDAEFHPSSPDQLDWAETNFFGFYNAEAHLNVGVYALFRPNLGTVSSTICMNSKRVQTPWHADFVDYRAHLPIPEPRSLLDYKLGNSLHIVCTKPNREWDIRYDDGEGTTIAVHYRAVMVPFDIHDPALDPMCAAGTEAGKFAWGTAYNGHFDQTGHFTGEVTVRGKRYAIDCVSTMDHSWGPRPERGKPNMSWLHAHIDDGNALHAIMGFDAMVDQTRLSLAHGYVLVDGELRGLARGQGITTRRVDRFPDTVELEFADAAGRPYRLAASALTSFPWQCWPNMISFNALAEWQFDGRRAFGEIQDFFELPQLNRLNSEPATARGHGSAAA